MMRWAWAKAAAAGLACAGFAAGQAPPTRVSVAPPAPSSPPEATDGLRAGVVIALRAAGQPERKVTVLRVTRPDGGEALADLQDLATGARYTVPARMLTAKPRPVAPPARAGLLYNPTRWSKPSQPSAPPVTKPPAASPVPSPKPVAYRLPPRPQPPPTEQRPAPRTPPAEPARTPPVSTARPVVPLPYERPLPPPVAPAPLTALRPATERGPAPEIRPAGLIAPLPPPVPAPVADPMADETGPYLRDLFAALRPSVRERAATALAECRYGSRPEVKARLAKAAASDPSPGVRAHCVRLLSKLGYHESRYLDELAGWAESGPSQLRQAARDALARLAVKN